MVGGVAEGAKSGTSVFGKEGKTRSCRGRGAQNLTGEPLVSLGYRNPNDTLPLPGVLLGEERDRRQAARTALKSSQASSLCTLKMFGAHWIISGLQHSL